MAGEYFYENYKPAGKSSRAKSSAIKIEKGLKRIIILTAIVLGAEIIWLFGISPCIPLSTIEVKGFDGFDGVNVLTFAGVNDKTSYFTANATKIERTLAAHYLVESARVIKRFPDRLSIFLEPRREVARSLAVLGGRQVPVYYDRYGVVFRIGDDGSSAANLNLPILSGLVFDEPTLGMKLPAAVGSLLESLDKIRTENPALLDAISEIQIVRKPFDGFDLVLYPVHTPVRVRAGSSLSAETIAYVLLLLDVVATGQPVPHEIDFRSDMGSYMLREVSFGE